MYGGRVHYSSIDEPNITPKGSYRYGEHKKFNNNNNYNNKNSYYKNDRPPSQRWFCPSCGESLFMEKTQCDICDTPRPAVILDAETVLKRKKERITEQWTCLKCETNKKDPINFGRDRKCRTCRTLRPTKEELEKYNQEKERKATEQRLAQEKVLLENQKETQAKEQVIYRAQYVYNRCAWDKLRLLYLGVRKDRSSAFANLPLLVVHKILQYLAYVPRSSGDALVEYFRKWPNGYLKFITDEFDHDYYTGYDSGWMITHMPHLPLTPFEFSLYYNKEGVPQTQSGRIKMSLGQFLAWFESSVGRAMSPETLSSIEEKCAKAEYDCIWIKQQHARIIYPEFSGKN